MKSPPPPKKRSGSDKPNATSAASAAKLEALKENLLVRLEDLLAALGTDLRDRGKGFQGPCPVHGGNNQGGCFLYRDGHTEPGCWKCFTKGCQEHFKKTLLGFVQGVLSRQRLGWSGKGDKVVPFRDVIDFCCAFLGVAFADVKADMDGLNLRRAARGLETVYRRPSTPAPKCTRLQARSLLEIPAAYYRQRGFSAEVLDRYDVGYCAQPGREMSGRVVVPIYDDDYRGVLGASGRSPFEKCPRCGCHHDGLCPVGEARAKASKWIHSKDFARDECLYNLWFARAPIAASGVAVLVEGPGDIWRLAEGGIDNGLALLGAGLADGQQVKLEGLKARTLLVLTDADPAGRQAAAGLEQRLARHWKVLTPAPPAKDLGEMTPRAVRDFVTPFLDKYGRKP
jgi:hypothetical protein